jgi:hypothetical protein
MDDDGKETRGVLAEDVAQISPEDKARLEEEAPIREFLQQK